MPVEPYTDMVNHAFANQYAVPHFNICNLETIRAVAAVAQERRSPVIFGIHPVESDYAGAANLAGLIRSEIGNRPIRAAIHLDHGPSVDHVVQAIQAGYTSVMFDGSTIPLKDNVQITSEVVSLAAAAGLSVEAEVGTIGKTAEYGAEIENPHLADPQACAQVAATGIDALAVAIGNAHGVYIAEPKLEFDRLASIREATNIPLVLHGGSGIPLNQVQQAITMGIAKFNIGTNVHVAFTRACRTYLNTNPGSHDVMGMLNDAQAAVRDVVEAGIETAMSGGRY
ncbi:MAG: ketose-bisphosphate aldolase [Beutenbergiaceae bacterium]